MNTCILTCIRTYIHTTQKLIAAYNKLGPRWAEISKMFPGAHCLSVIRHVCMHMCMYVCVHVYMLCNKCHACVVFMYICMCVCMFVH